MAGFRGLVSNALAVASSPSAWRLARRAVVRHGAVQHVDELTAFARIGRTLSPRTVVEIGTAQGGVFWLLCRISADDATLVSLDLLPESRFSGGEKTTVNLYAMKGPAQVVQAIYGNSHSLEMPSKVLEALRGRPIDLLFIDGDHTYEGVRADYQMFSPLVRAGGLIAFHDIVPSPWKGCEVDRFWAELKSDPSLTTQTILGTYPSHFGGIGIVTQR